MAFLAKHFMKRKAAMKKKSYKGSRCEKRSMSKCADGVVRTYNAIESRYAEKLEENPDVKEFRTQVILDGLELGEYCSDFVAVKTDGDLMVRERVLLSQYSGGSVQEFWLVLSEQIRRHMLYANLAQNIQTHINIYV